MTSPSGFNVEVVRHAPLIVAALAVAAVGYALFGPLAALLAIVCAGVGFGLGRTSRESAATDQDRAAREAAHAAGTARKAMQTIIEALDFPTLALAPDSSVVAVNAGARELFPEAAQGRQLHQVTRHPAVLDAVQKARETGVPQSCELTGRAPTLRRVLASVTPVLVEVSRGGSAGAAADATLLLQFRDLTEQDRLMQLRTDFIANASHELRTPLASIKGFVETLQGPASADPPARQKFLGIMHAQASRMARILDDLLSLSRIEMRQHVAPSDIVDLAALLRTTVDGLAPIAREAGITLSYQPAPGDMTVNGDRDELVQVFQNLIQNAIKYGRANGRVDIALGREPAPGTRAGKIVVRVTDDGPGIAQEHLPRLTERFYRVDTATSRERGGTGLGLAIVKHIVVRHRGELKIQSTVGQGSTFSVALDARS